MQDDELRGRLRAIDRNIKLMQQEIEKVYWKDYSRDNKIDQINDKLLISTKKGMPIKTSNLSFGIILYLIILLIFMIQLLTR